MLARQDQGVPLPQLLQLAVEGLQGAGRNVGPLAVDLGLSVQLELDVDAAHTAGERDEVARHPQLGEPRADGLPGKAGQKAQSPGLHPQVAEHDGDVNPLAAAAQLLPGGAVGRAQLEAVQVDRVVQRGVKGHSIDHRSATSLMMVKER